MVRMWTKPETQKFLKMMKGQGFTVKKDTGMYTVTDDEVVVMTALLKDRFYIIRLNEEYFDVE